ncbi:LLM class flavin-dependent oxidoreductase [Terrarubrum flagellatum]|uniref:LLM class flavin-dependent oxidoreductase n=1 Tax=Terrirubrum flagellatum TaxID=2895980 RepID=UPI003144F2CD
MPAKKQISFNLLDMATVSHNNYGLWAHPSNQKHARYKTVDFWMDFARECERARFDTLFLADALGVSAGFGGSNDVAIREGMHVPDLDPFTPIAAMAAATRSIGFAATCSTTYEQPFHLARRLSSLDHLSNGRIGVNIVTSYLPNANENFGVDPNKYTHDERYDVADEFMEVCYKLWEASWEEGAILRDRVNQVFADPVRVHRIDHKGKYFSVAGPHLVEPSRQRTPVIYQAGTSGRGKQFAARHAEVVFCGGRSLDAVKENVRAIREEAVAQGRRPDDIKILVGATIVAARTRRLALAKKEDYQEMTRADGYVAHMYGAGFDLSRFGHDEVIAEIIKRGGAGAEHLGRYPYAAGTTVGDVIRMSADIAGHTTVPLFACGSGEDIADEIEMWIETLGCDGFLLRQLITPHTVADFADYVMPVLQKRGVYREDYDGSTLRENLFGAGQRKPLANHPSAAYRAAAGE